MRKQLLSMVSAAGLLAVLPLAGAQALQIKSSDVHAMDYPTTQAIAYMDELLNDWSGGRITVEIFHSMQLGGEKEALGRSSSARWR